MNRRELLKAALAGTALALAARVCPWEIKRAPDYWGRVTDVRVYHGGKLVSQRTLRGDDVIALTEDELDYDGWVHLQATTKGEGVDITDNTFMEPRDRRAEWKMFVDGPTKLVPNTRFWDLSG